MQATQRLMGLVPTNYGGGPWVAESAWNSPPFASGGGISPDGLLIPSWQQGVANYNNAGSTSLRNVPDVAMEADLDNYFCGMGTCGSAGGTSFASPRWAAFMALINEQATETGKATGGLGFINPAIYSIGKGSDYNNDFHDIATGNNDSDNQPIWYNAVSGYDLVTGWGSPNGQSLINDLAGPVVSGFLLSTSPGDVPVAQNSSGAAIISVTDAGGFSGNVSLTASGLPSGLTASFNPSSTAGTSLLTLTASSSATVGTAPVTITGTSGSLSSKISLFVTVNPPAVQSRPVDEEFSSTNIGSTSSPSALTLTFTTAGTLATIGVLTQGAANLDFTNAGGGTCSMGTAYAVNATCTVNVSFAPKFPGTRYGAVVLEDANGNQLAKSYVEGTGVGPQATFIPGTQSSIGSGLISPESVATRGDGSIYVTDYGNGNGTGALYLETFSNGTYTQTKVGCTFTSPTAVAMDGSGTLYVTDPGVPAVYKVIVLSNGTCSQSAIGSGFGTPWSVAVDGSGDVYVTDLGSSTLAAAVYKETLETNGTYAQSTVGTGWISPAGISVDSKGNVDVADRAIPGVFMETPSGGSYTQTPIGEEWTAPSGVAVDGNGNIYVADAGNGSVYGGGSVLAGIYKEVAAGGSYLQTAIGTGWVIPGGISVDAGGNVYVPDQTRGVFKEDLADAPVLGFANAVIGTMSKDSPKTEVISNLGSSTLQFSALSYPSDFPEATGISTDCTASTSLPTEGSCTISLEFLPTAALGSNISLLLNESVNLTTNTLNSTTRQGVGATGTEVLPGGGVALAVSPDPAAVGSVVTLTATVTGSSGGPTPTGSVTFYNGTSPIAGPLTLTNGATAYSTTSLPMGIYSIVASYSGDANYLGSNSNTITESVVTAPGASISGNTGIGNQSVGSPSIAIPLSITFSVSETLGSISVLTEGVPNLDFANAGGGSCSLGTQYAANSSCTVNVTFTPQCPGTRYGAVVLTDNNGNVIGTGYLEGIGVGPQTAFLPGTLSPIGNGFGFPQGVALDGNRSLYVADASNAVIYKETLANGTYAQTTFTSGFSQPYGVAVDGAENVYVTDIGNHAVYKETPSNGTYIQTVIGYGFISPMGVAVDTLGNIYVADFGNGVNPGTVYLETLSNGSYSQSTIGSGFVSPQGVAVDGSGNVYVADSANGNGTATVYLLTPVNGSYSQTTIGSGWITPTGVAVDGIGNVYITDDAFDLGAGFVVKESPQPNRSYVQSTMLGSTNTPYPAGIAVDGLGNVYITDNFDGVLYRDDIADPPALSFANTVSGTVSSDSPKTLTVQNAGNAPLTFSSVSYPADFPEAPGVSSDCTSSTSLALEAGCTLSIDFKPASLSGTTQPTSLNENVTVTTNSMNNSASRQVVAVSGTEIAPMAAVILSVPANVATVGASVTFTATVSGQNGLTSPTGTVTFYANSAILGSVPLTNGVATYSTSSLALGTALIGGSYSGDQNYPSAASNTVTMQIIPSSTFGTENIGSSSTSTITVTFAAKVTLGSISVVTQGVPNLDFTNAGGGTCATGKAYSSGASCTVNVTFQPRFAGARFGALVLIDNRGNVIQTKYLEGTGVGPQLTYQPAVQSTISSSLTDVGGIVADENGDIYVLSGTNLSGTVTKFSVSGSSYTTSMIPSSIHYSSGYIAVDGSGAVFISDTYISSKQWNCRVVKETLAGSTYTESVIGPTLQNCALVPAVDGAGNVYIAEEGTSTLWKETPVAGGTYTQTTLQIPPGVYIDELAVDGSGNLYIDSYNTLVKVPSGGGSTSTVIASTSDVFCGIAIGAFGDVYTVDVKATSSSYSVLKFTPSSGGYAQTTVIPPTAFQLTNPFEPIAVDGSENIYTAIPNGSNGIIDYDIFQKTGSGTPPSLSFAATNVGSTSADSPKTVTLNNIGNSALTFAVPGSGINPSVSSNFSLNGVTTCPQIAASGSPATLSADGTCVYGINFTPSSMGTINGSLILTDNAMNAVNGTQTISLSGTGNSQTQMAMLTIGPNGNSQVVWLPREASPSNPTVNGNWVDAQHQTLIVGLAEFVQGSCTWVSAGNLTVASDLLGATWATPTKSFTLPNNQCPGRTYQFSTAYYTWGSSQGADLQDRFVLNWTTPDGQFNESISSNAEYDHVNVTQAVPNGSGQNPPLTATASLASAPGSAQGYTWKIVGGGGSVLFSNGADTIQSTTDSIQLFEPNPSGTSVPFTIEADVANPATIGGTLDYGPIPQVFGPIKITGMVPSPITLGTSGTITISGTGLAQLIGPVTVAMSGGIPVTNAAVNTQNGTITATYDATNCSIPLGAENVTISGTLSSGSSWRSNQLALSVVLPPAPDPQIMFSGTNIVGNPQTVVVGQQIALTGAQSLPVCMTLASMQWTTPTGTTVGGFSGSAASGAVTVTPANPTTPDYTFYWVSSTSQSSTYQTTYQYTMQAAGQTVTSRKVAGVFIVTGPPSVTASTSGNSAGISPDQSEMAWGIKFEASDQTVSGLTWLQFVSSDSLTYKFADGGQAVCSGPAGFDAGANGDQYPYASGSTTEDSPADPLNSNLDEIEAIGSIQFQMYLLWNPGVGNSSIPVPLGSISWSAAGDATFNSSTQQWTLKPGAVPTAGQFQPSSQLSSYMDAGCNGHY